MAPRGGAPKVSAAVAPVEEVEEEEEAASGQFVWDPKRGCLVDAADLAPEKKAVDAGRGKQPEDGAAEADQAEAAARPKAEAEAGEDGPRGEGEGEESSTAEDSGDEEDEVAGGDVDADTVSRLAFLKEASTPELIQQAVAIGGHLAEGVMDRWVLDKVTQLHFYYKSGSRQMQCWNPSQGYMYLWKGRGKLEFQWTPSIGSAGSVASAPPPGVVPPPGYVAAAPAAVVEASPSEAAHAPAAASSSSSARALWVTVLPPSVLDPLGLAGKLLAELSDETEVPSKALAHLVGKKSAGLRELEGHSGASLSIRDREEEEQTAHIVIKGTKDQIASAKQAIEQKLVMVMGEKKMERLVKHQNSQLMDKMKNETGSDAAAGGVDGLKEFAEKWKLKAVLVRKLKKLDAMTQRYLIRHFKPWKAKPENALRSYVTTLLMNPQRWRLEALYESGELDGDICETALVGQDGAIVGLQRSAVQEILGEAEPAMEEDGQLIELEIDTSLGKLAGRVFGDVQPKHCRLVNLGDDFYCMALESKIGTVVDGRKYRQEDGPVAIRDGSTLAVGKYLLYCEVGSAASLQDRRRRMLAGESFWKLIGAARKAPAAAAAEAGAPPAPEAAEAAATAGAGAGDAESAVDESEGASVDASMSAIMDAALGELGDLLDDEEDDEEVDAKEDTKGGDEVSASTSRVADAEEGGGAEGGEGRGVKRKHDGDAAAAVMAEVVLEAGDAAVGDTK